jgi:integrase
MKFEDVPGFMAELSECGEVSAAALQFLILTAARTGEVIAAPWDEIDWQGRTWSIAAERAKSGRVHVVPLSTGALAVLQTMLPLRDIGDGFIFPGRKGGLSQMTLLALLQRRMKRAVTCRGFRSSFRDWCGDVAGVPREIAEAALAHVVSDATERAYRRGTAIEKRRELMQQWSDFCLLPTTADVVQLRTA